MFSGINQSSMFSQVNFSSYWQRYASTNSQTQADTASTTQSTEEDGSQQTSVRDAFAEALKKSGMSEDEISSLPEKFWEKAEKKAGNNEEYNFGEDKQLQKLADFLAKKAELVKSEQGDDDSSSDSANISQEAKEAAANAATETEEAEESGVVSTETEEEEESSNPFASIFDEFKEKLNNLLMSSLGLGETSGTSNSTKMMSFSASFEISYSSMVAVAGENGMTMQETSFSLKGSFEFMGIGSSSSFGDSFNPFDFLSENTGSTEGTNETEETDANNPFAKLQEYFSPEATADRILDFSLGFFGNSKQYKEGGNTEESRQSFADVIGAAIQKGFDQALGTLGKLPDETQEEVDETHSRVFDGLDNFVKTGSKDGEEDDEVKEPSFDYYAYSSVFEMNYSSTTTYFSASETEEALESLYDKYFNKGYGAQTQVEDETKQVKTEQEEEQNVKQINLTA